MPGHLVGIPVPAPSRTPAPLRALLCDSSSGSFLGAHSVRVNSCLSASPRSFRPLCSGMPRDRRLAVLTTALLATMTSP